MISKIKHHLTRLLGLNPLIDRWVRYRDPRKYWQKRGGETYFQEQEAAADRSLRSDFITGQIRGLEYESLLEVGCGYGKQLSKLRRGEATLLCGIDFSRPQLMKALVYTAERLNLAEANGQFLPFQDKSFDAAFSSAVILHNDEAGARRILSEMIRVSRRYLVHNEDMDIKFSRYGYDLTRTYQALGLRIVKSAPIPEAPDPSITQFTIAELPEAGYRRAPEEIPIQYHAR